MSDEAGTKGWLQNLPVVLTALAAILTAIAGLAAAFSGLLPELRHKHPVQDCSRGYMWRQAYRGDHVWVTAETHERTVQDNELAASRRNPEGGAYGADSCKAGYAWRDAFDGDRVCVTTETRDQAKADNEQAALRIKR